LKLHAAAGTFAKLSPQTKQLTDCQLAHAPSIVINRMLAAEVEQVKQDAARVVRNLPGAHASWQFWRNAAFRRAISDVVEALYVIDVDRFTDEHFETLERVVKVVIEIINIHVAGLDRTTRDVVDREYFRDMTTRLKTAIDGLQQGMAPDPQKRPTDEELMDRLAAGLRRSGAA
jgi:hypothetical protein